MDNQNILGANSKTFAIFVIAVVVGAVGLYTENSGFTTAGMIFFVISLILGIQQFRKNK